MKFKDYIGKWKLKCIMRQRIVPAALILGLLAGMPGAVRDDSGLFKPELVYATSATDIRDQAQSDLEDITGQIGGLEQEQNAVNSELDAATQQLTQLMAEQQLLEGEMEYLQGQIDQANLDLEEAKEVAEEQYEAMKLRIQFMYENSTGDSIWQAIIGASGFVDMLNRIEYVNQVYNTDRDMLEEYQETVARIENLTEELNRQMADMKILEESYKEQEAALNETMKTLQSLAADYAQRIKNAKEKAADYAKIIEEQNEIIRKEEERKRQEEERKRQEEERKRQEEERKRQEEERKRQEEESKQQEENNTEGTETQLPSSETQSSESKDPPSASSVSGEEIVQYGRQFVGNRYVWGGNSLTNGCDCSGFVNQVYGHFGISVPRYSMSFVSVGKEVTRDSIRPGDIVVYKPKAGIGHVAIYAGNGLIVEAQSTAAGITDNRSVDCREIIAIRRVL